MKRMIAIGAATVLLVSVFLISLSLAAAGGDLGVVKKDKATIAGDVSIFLGEAAVMTGTPIPADSNYHVILAIPRTGEDVDIFCGALGNCSARPQRIAESVVKTRTNKTEPDIQINYYKGSCYVCSGGFCFQVC